MEKRIAIYGTGLWAGKLLDYAQKWGVELEYFVNSDAFEGQKYRDHKVILPEDIDWKNIDYLIVSSDKYYDSIISTLETRNLDYLKNVEKVIDCKDGFGIIYERDCDYYVTKLSDGTNYLYRSTDKCIGPLMKYTGDTFSQDLIDKFIEHMIKLHEPKDDDIFLDIGANIGSTSIYVKKKFPNMKVIGFEPGRENYDVFRINCILNKVEDITIEKLAVSDCEDLKYYVYDPENPGGSYFISESEKELECIKTISIDNYIKAKSIDSKKVSYIWIDVEGMESDVIIGAEQLLKSKRIPLMQEFNPTSYIASGKADKYIEIMNECYDFFADMKDNNIKKIPVSQLRDYMMHYEGQTDLLFY